MSYESAMNLKGGIFELNSNTTFPFEGTHLIFVLQGKDRPYVLSTVEITQYLSLAPPWVDFLAHGVTDSSPFMIATGVK